MKPQGRGDSPLVCDEYITSRHAMQLRLMGHIGILSGMPQG